MAIEVIHHHKSSSAEAYRTLRSNIQFSNYGESIKSIVVTSSNPSEGKSTTAVNLAASFVQIGKKVLLIDADMRHPTQNKLLYLDNSKGLSTLLASIQDMENIIQSVPLEHGALDVITAGPIPPNPAEMLNSAVMERFLKVFTAHYDLVMIDTPPVLAITDSQILARIADATLLVVDTNKTKSRHVIESKKRLDNVGAHLIGTVLNKVDDLFDGYYYKY